MSKQQAGRGGVVDELLHLVLGAHSSHIPVNSMLAAAAEPPSSPSSRRPHFLWSMKYLQHTEQRRTQTAIYLRYLSRFSGMGVRRAHSLHVGCI